ncbi:MAG: DUF1638 domain-containing protein [Deltaproteobacteria bacterium]|jgi:hypothetical protein|nr:DUF1638 domain-containing protein [Deltaproteobacteria bacterium]
MKEGKLLGIVACDVIRKELEAAAANRDVLLHFLPYSLHSTPSEMGNRIKEGIAAVKAMGAGPLALGYGLCSNGVVGVENDGPLVMPRCHDCIGMLLGSPKRYFEMFRQFPGTYFLTDGWIRNQADPLSSVEIKYTPRIGEKKAFRGMSLELANYKTFCFVNTGVGNLESIKARTKENCRIFGKEYLEVDSGIEYFRALVDGPHGEEEFISLSGGQKIISDYFYNII